MDVMDMNSIAIRENQFGWFIHAFRKEGYGGGWLSSVRDIWITTSAGAESRSWNGYYATKHEAENRLKEYKMKTSKQIRIGGE